MALVDDGEFLKYIAEKIFIKAQQKNADKIPIWVC